MITACDVHPLIVPRIRNYLGNELKLDEPTKLKWIRHWFNEGSRAIESHLAGEKETGRFCHGDRITLADVCVVSQAVGAKIFECDPAPFPTAAAHRRRLPEARRLRPRASAQAAGRTQNTERVLPSKEEATMTITRRKFLQGIGAASPPQARRGPPPRASRSGSA